MGKAYLVGALFSFIVGFMSGVLVFGLVEFCWEVKNAVDREVDMKVRGIKRNAG